MTRNVILNRAHRVKMAVALITLSLFLALSTAPCGGTDASHCLSRGFTPNLMCSSCNELKQFGLEPLEDECRSCCQEDGAASEETVVG